MLLGIQVSDRPFAFRPCISMTFDCDSEGLDAILDYPSYFQLVDAFRDTQRNFSSLADTLIRSQQMYKHGLSGTGSFVENHDQPRWPSITKDPGVCHSCCFAVS